MKQFYDIHLGDNEFSLRVYDDGEIMLTQVSNGEALQELYLNKEELTQLINLLKDIQLNYKEVYE